MPLQHSLLELTSIGHNGLPLTDRSSARFLVQIDTDNCAPKGATSTVFGDTRTFLSNLKDDLASELSLLSPEHAQELCHRVQWSDAVILRSSLSDAPLINRKGVIVWRLVA
ncbi:hypothetical protein [Nibricoccus aquaticus]|uniref:hypothetical protein n=1 Tax=Nibricoccus aquaticus TaxID=2576891 RepID=UPI0010FDEDBC|nr:hypothetical protein [Nibricoccus aquaticus]